MSSRYRHRRTSNAGTAFPATVEAGEMVVNTANRQLAVGDADPASLGTPKPLLGVTIFDAKGNYAVGDLVIHNDGTQNTIWRCITAHNAKAWDATHFEEAGGGKVIMSANTPTTGLKDGLLWFDIDTGVLSVYYVEADGSSSQWVPCITPAPAPAIPNASATVRGITLLASNADAIAGTNADKSTTPANLKAAIDAIKDTLSPVGSVNAYYGATAPAGWLLCDGSAIPAAHTKLIALCGANTPDLRGKFIRGLDNGANVDTGRVLGSSQGDDVKPHKHRLEDGSNVVIGMQSTALAAGTSNSVAARNGGANTTWAKENTGAETRPKNVALNYIIRHD